MTPLFLFAVIAGLAGWSLHRKWWGAVLFCCAMLVWMLVIQLCVALSLHGGMN